MSAVVALVITMLSTGDIAAASSLGISTFDSAMTEFIAQGYPGGSLAVVRDGRLVHARGYGIANPANKRWARAATAATRYRQASISKPVTTSLLRQLVAKGVLSMDTPVFPLLGVVPADTRANAITVRMLKDHTSGLACDCFLWESRQAAAYYGVASPPGADTMIRWTAHYALAADPGTVYRYNNTNYALLSRVIERATGRAWIDLVRDMGTPLGATSWRLVTSLGKPADEARYVEAPAWRYGPSVFDSVPGTVEMAYGGFYFEPLKGGSSLVSSVVDMARYFEAVASGALPAPEDNPIPTLPGWNYVYIYNGSMPGVYTFLMRLWNGTNSTVIAGAFNHRDAGPIDATINQRILDAFGATTVWPAVDLFPDY